MFNFLKKKLKSALSQFSSKVEEEAKEEEVPKEEAKEEEVPKEETKEQEDPKEEAKEQEVPKEEVKEQEVPKEEAKEQEVPKEEVKEQEQKSFLSHFKFNKKEKQEDNEIILNEIEKDLKKDQEILSKKNKSIFGKIKEVITTKSLSENQFENLFFDLEIILLENNVAYSVIEKIKNDLKKELVETKVLRGKIKEIIETTLKRSLIEILNIKEINLFELINNKKPFTIVFLGINGTGKTTTVAKFAKMLNNNNYSCVLAAADTFRAAAIQQLEEHANNLNIKIIKQDYGSDPAAVTFDAIKYAEAKKIDVVLIDTAGRQHSNSNLMDELKKIIRVSKPDLTIFIGDSLTGNDCVEQATKFNELIGIDANILTKVDVDEKGGAALSISYVTNKPILFIGNGQDYENLEIFNYKKILEKLGF